MKAKFTHVKLVANWQTGYKWFSTWAFALIVFLATTDLPPEIRDKLTAIVAVCGLILRFVKQKPLTLLDGGEKETERW